MSVRLPAKACQGCGVSAGSQRTTAEGLLQRAGGLRRPDRRLVRLGGWSRSHRRPARGRRVRVA
jgi:hypothetical protein